MIAVFCIGYREKTVNIALHSDHHRTTISRFLRNEKWDDAPPTATMKTLVISIIYDESRKSGMPILVIIDDTISSKTKPSSKAKHPQDFSLQRHLHKCIFGSSQVWSRENKIIREQTDFVVECSSHCAGNAAHALPGSIVTTSRTISNTVVSGSVNCHRLRSALERIHLMFVV